jgi:hypothetical protein
MNTIVEAVMFSCEVAIECLIVFSMVLVRYDFRYLML